MLCDNCKKNEAVVFVKQIINGYRTEHRLCLECNQKRQDEDMRLISQSIDGIFGSFAGIPAPRRIRICKHCGTTGEEVLESGYVGCSECYNEFKEILLPYIEKSQYRLGHEGKKPNQLEQ